MQIHEFRLRGEETTRVIAVEGYVIAGPYTGQRISNLRIMIRHDHYVVFPDHTNTVAYITKIDAMRAAFAAESPTQDGDIYVSPIARWVITPRLIKRISYHDGDMFVAYAFRR